MFLVEDGPFRDPAREQSGVFPIVSLVYSYDWGGQEADGLGQALRRKLLAAYLVGDGPCGYLIGQVIAGPYDRLEVAKDIIAAQVGHNRHTGHGAYSRAIILRVRGLVIAQAGQPVSQGDYFSSHCHPPCG